MTTLWQAVLHNWRIPAVPRICSRSICRPASHHYSCWRRVSLQWYNDHHYEPTKGYAVQTRYQRPQEESDPTNCTNMRLRQPIPPPRRHNLVQRKIHFPKVIMLYQYEHRCCRHHQDHPVTFIGSSLLLIIIILILILLLLLLLYQSRE